MVGCIKSWCGHDQGVFAGVAVVAAALPGNLELIFVVEILRGLVIDAHFKGGRGDWLFVTIGKHVEQEEFAQIVAAPGGVDGNGADVHFITDEPITGIPDDG